MSRRFLGLMATGVLAVATLPSTSAAQLGKLTKKATTAAANAAGVPTGNSRSVKKIDLTPQQLAQVNAGLESAVKTGPETIKRWEKAQEDYDKALGEYTKKKEKWDACIEREQQKGRDQMDAVNKKSEKATQDMQAGMPDTAALMAKAQAAQVAAERVKNGTATAADRQTLAEYQQMMAGMSGNVAGVQAAMQEGQAVHQAVSDSIKKKCGEEPTPPSKGAIAGSRAGKAGGAPPTSAAEEINQNSAAAAGMTEDEYRLMKEKAMGYAASNTTVAAGTDTPPDQAKAINDALAQTRDLMAQANKANVPLM